MGKLYDINKKFECENGFYATADLSRFSKFITHLNFFKQTPTVRGKIIIFDDFFGNNIEVKKLPFSNAISYIVK